MRSAFGVEHGEVAKRSTVPDWMTSALPGSTVAAFNNSRRHKYEAGARNLGAKIMGGIAGSAVGLGAMAVAGRKIPALNRTSQLGRMTISAEKKKGWAQAMAMGSGGGIGGSYMGNRSLKRIKQNQGEYKYRKAPQ